MSIFISSCSPDSEVGGAPGHASLEPRTPRELFLFVLLCKNHCAPFLGLFRSSRGFQVRNDPIQGREGLSDPISIFRNARVSISAFGRQPLVRENAFWRRRLFSRSRSAVLADPPRVSFRTPLPASWRESGPHGKNLIGSPMRRSGGGQGLGIPPSPPLKSTVNSFSPVSVAPLFAI